MRESAIAFIFAAQGTQWPGMGRTLMSEDAAFRSAISQCDESIRRHFRWSLLRELEARDDEARLHRDPQMIQPALTSLQIALTESLRRRGVTPAAVGSLSMGEAAAAYCAGILDLNGAIDVACSTARLTETKLPEGLMGFVQATWAETTTLIADVRDRVAIAVELGAGLTVISGEASAVRRVLAIASARGIASGPLPLAQAYHSPDVASLGEAFRARLSNLRLRSPQIDSYSSVTAAVQNEPGVDHWWQICSKPARFYMLALAMIRDGYRRFIEIGPHPMISQTIEEAAAHRGVAVDVRASMRRGGSAMARQEACVAV